MMIKPFITRKIIKSILVIFLINTTLGTIIASFTYNSHSDHFLTVFLNAQIITHSVSSLSFLANFMIRPSLVSLSGVLRFVISVGGIFLAATCGVFLGIGLVKILLSKDIAVSGSIVGILIPSLLITSIFIAVNTVIEQSREKQKHLEHDLHAFRKAQESGSDRHLSLKDGDFHRIIKYADLIYLSSSGRVSVVHTKDKDYEVRELLGDMEKVLPKNIFLRIHKQFVVNTRFISGLRYYEGGRYNLHLADDDETVLPVGKSFTKDLKLRMKI